jgi:hypothetical protein
VPSRWTKRIRPAVALFAAAVWFRGGGVKCTVTVIPGREYFVRPLDKTVWLSNSEWITVPFKDRMILECHMFISK